MQNLFTSERIIANSIPTYHSSQLFAMTEPELEAHKSSDGSRDAGRVERDSPRGDERRRSRSPKRDRRDEKPRRKDAGFKWKEKQRYDDEARDRDAGLKRGYRDHYRPKSRSRSPPTTSPKMDEKPRDRRQETEGRPEKKKEKKEKKPAPAVPQQPMIIVTVNDRLGTKKAVPCFASDSVKDFKIIVASLIGRQPHEILLKRQGERPFKDVLTLQDYGVSNNVQLDLEVDTGD